MDFLQKVFYGVFELPLLRNAQKRHKKKKKKKGTYLPHFPSARYTSLSILFFFGAPRSASSISHIHIAPGSQMCAAAPLYHATPCAPLLAFFLAASADTTVYTCLRYREGVQTTRGKETEADRLLKAKKSLSRQQWVRHSAGRIDIAFKRKSYGMALVLASARAPSEKGRTGYFQDATPPR
jgi:hypothetical protein